ncbi:hypothetical protein, variant [Verruconis gallopava]|uniref:Uncharacterized protein n=1 Tax=Verruconis gallopava TaxID=253628 RepID=A0A0D2AB91_9PEZI|nr:uncharacterized protein PV09_05157 [Verruconis gallopava]XP_016213729.1 hypothetical protein, variant [Verruconis gallopava]KIW03859.1 hypothetical protein PV09_05157 [Verruconis gallopava]KIW03860.1 hypothetical protein, variant [Verruconis gallopava]
MPDLGLWSSKHAPYVRANRSKAKEPNGMNGAERARGNEPSVELARFQHAVRRLKWKLPYLADSHRKATCMLDDNGLAEDEKKEIETMFKLDFYEYYTVLEKALVHLLGVWDIAVEALRNDLTHTYHAAILTTLQAPTNPLYKVLGCQPVFGHLLAAKQLRNRWKNAEVAGQDDSPPPLQAFEIEQMLLSIFNAFDEAERLARDHLRKSQNDGDRGGKLDEKEIELEAIEYVDEMDWE